MATTTAAPHDTPAQAPRHDCLGRLPASPGASSSLAGGVACIAILGLMYASNLRHFVHTWSTDENYSHGFLVPLLSLYFAREAMRRGPISRRGGEILGAGMLAVSVLARLATVVVPVGIV